MRRVLPKPRPHMLVVAALALAAGTACELEDPTQLRAGPGGGAADPSAPAGDGTTEPAPSPVVHLTSTQYVRTLEDLFAPTSLKLPGAPPESPGVDYETAAKSQALGAAHVEAYQANAEAAAEAAVDKLDVLLGCTPASPAEETSCIASFVKRFGKRAFRRPLAEAEVQDLAALYATVRASADLKPAVSLLVQAILQSPSFLYRIERGEANPTGPFVRLTAYEVASRMSYFLWNTMPDAALFEAADAGTLATTAGVEAHARRMLASPKARAAMRGFLAGWLRFDRMRSLSKDAGDFPSFDDQTAEGLRAGASKLVEELFFERGDLRTFFTSSHAWVNAKTAPIYGVEARGTELVRVDLDPKQRSGVLTDAGWLAGHAHSKESSPILRGVTLLDRVLCQPVPPADLANITPPKIDPNAPTTTRKRLEEQHAVGGCASCHQRIDPLGFAFEGYDAVGRFRTKDNGFPVDATGTFRGARIDGAVELSRKLADDPSVASCVASHLTRYALGLDGADLTTKNVAALGARFAGADLDLRELVVAIVTSDLFRMRVVTP